MAHMTNIAEYKIHIAIAAIHYMTTAKLCFNGIVTVIIIVTAIMILFPDVVDFSLLLSFFLFFFREFARIQAYMGVIGSRLGFGEVQHRLINALKEARKKQISVWRLVKFWRGWAMSSDTTCA